MQFSALGFLAVKPFMKKPTLDSAFFDVNHKSKKSEIIDVEVIEK